MDEDLYECTDEFHKWVNTRGSYKCECDQDLYFIDGKCRGEKFSVILEYDWLIGSHTDVCSLIAIKLLSAKKY